ncbi:MAG: hypothetical protein FWC07_06195 [Defluviitaleaceae bacterium]|nr:hypothetical protein [Defluviitaleaceae bacterium]
MHFINGKECEVIMPYNIEALRTGFKNADITVKFEFIEKIKDAGEAALAALLYECIWELARCMHDTDGAFREYAREYGFMEKYAQRENTEALYLMGCLYLHEETDTHPADYEKVAYWLDRAAQLNHPKAMSKLAGAHFRGVFSKANAEEGVRLVGKLAKPPHSDPIEMMHLGVIHYHGRHGFIADQQRGMKWIENAMDIVLEKGIEIPFDYLHALSIIMFEQGVKNNNPSEARGMVELALWFINKSLEDKAGMKLLVAEMGEAARQRFIGVRDLIIQTLSQL